MNLRTDSEETPEEKTEKAKTKSTPNVEMMKKDAICMVKLVEAYQANTRQMIYFKAKVREDIDLFPNSNYPTLNAEKKGLKGKETRFQMTTIDNGQGNGSHIIISEGWGRYWSLDWLENYELLQ